MILINFSFFFNSNPKNLKKKTKTQKIVIDDEPQDPQPKDVDNQRNGGKSNQSMVDDQRSLLLPLNESFKCRICYDNFNTEDVLEWHIRLKHNSDLNYNPITGKKKYTYPFFIVLRLK